jgi:hypothetical protein
MALRGKFRVGRRPCRRRSASSGDVMPRHSRPSGAPGLPRTPGPGPHSRHGRSHHPQNARREWAESAAASTYQRRSARRDVPIAVSLHFLQSGKHAGRVLNEYSTDTTAPQLWGWVPGGTAPAGAGPGEPSATGARRPTWLVENISAAEPWRCASRLSPAE